MEFFKESKNTFIILGICLNQKTFNRKMLMVLAGYLMNIVLKFIHIIRIANTFSEYAESIFTTTTSMLFAILFVIVAVNWKATTASIALIDVLAEKSKFICMHTF